MTILAAGGLSIVCSSLLAMVYFTNGRLEGRHKYLYYVAVWGLLSFVENLLQYRNYGAISDVAWSVLYAIGLWLWLAAAHNWHNKKSRWCYICGWWPTFVILALDIVAVASGGKLSCAAFWLARGLALVPFAFIARTFFRSHATPALVYLGIGAALILFADLIPFIHGDFRIVIFIVAKPLLAGGLLYSHFDRLHDEWAASQQRAEAALEIVARYGGL